MEMKQTMTLARVLFVLASLCMAIFVVNADFTVDLDESNSRSMPNCQLATHRGRRKYQEDRMLCTHNVHTLGDGSTNVSINIAAIFDGHNGAEASEMASKLLLKYFSQHVHNLFTSIYSTPRNKSAVDMTSHMPQSSIQHYPHISDFDRWTLATSSSLSIDMEVLKVSMLQTVYDIDGIFSKEAHEKNLKSGSTAVIILITDGDILVVNVGDSKIILCSKSTYLPQDVKVSLAKLRRGRQKATSSTESDKRRHLTPPFESKCFLVHELTEDHHPDNVAERNRVEAAGGYVEEWAGVPRVNGILAVSRSIGDVYLKRYGVISIPDVTGWQHLTGNDTYLVVGSDGIFEKLSTQEVCNLLWDVDIRANSMMESLAIKKSLADYIVSVALERGTTDNMSAIVISL